ncbi:uncharacterized protein LOC142222023 isoform X1 [Haematobia irritans]|uniref:uncharacterized protein LOC142220624 isoform X1 n=1 Tax=Haematobia irritans TaxID=7368 RepID=UPI003F50AEFC
MITKRHHRRLVKSEREKFLKLMDGSQAFVDNSDFNVRKEQPTNLPDRCTEVSLAASSVTSDNSVDDISLSENNNPQESDELSLSEKLKFWFLKHKPTVQCTRSILKILKTENLDVPVSVKGLLGQKEKCNDRTVSPGKYVHIGLKRQIIKFAHSIPSSICELVLDIGIDGLSLFKSCPLEVWPILGHVKNIKDSHVFMIGYYVGKKKPHDINSFLHDFVNEYSSFQTSGLLVNERRLKLSIRAFVCDAPAKSFVCGIKGHVSFNGCAKCQQCGQRIDNVNTYSVLPGLSRNDDDFRLRKYNNFHTKMHQNMELSLEKIGIGMISQFPIDCMHAIDLGVIKKILARITNKTAILPVSSKAILSISDSLLALKPYIPREFARKPRTLVEISRWKATEFRQFVLYTGIVVLKDNLPDELYEHFLLLHVAYRILLLSPCNAKIEQAQQILNNFVEIFPVVYGRSSVSYNVHSLLHLPECVKQFGNLNDFSAYCFENFMQIIKRSVRMSRHVIQQIYNSFANTYIVPERPSLGPRFHRKIIQSILTTKGYFSCKSPDNVCLMNNKTFLNISKIIDESTFQANTFKTSESFYTNPINSEELDIVFAETDYEEKQQYSFTDILAKVVKIPYKSGFVLIPQIHSFC